MKRWLILIVAVVVLVVLIGGLKGFEVFKLFQGFKAQGVPKQTISTVKAAEQDWRPSLSAVGSVRAVRGADLSAEVAGIVESVNFDSGADAKAGQPLVRLRAGDDLAKLEALKATADLATLTLKRDQMQLEAEAVSKALVDNDTANLKNAKAQVSEQQALVDKKLIRAPFAGQLGIRAVDVGQYVNPGDKIVTLQQLDPVYIDFYLPQQSLGQVAAGQTVTATTDSYAGSTFSGEIIAVDPKIDTDTRNVQVRAKVPNPDRKLLPGMYANVGIEVGEAGHYITLPQNAVTYNPYGETVFVLVTAGQYKKEQDEKNKETGIDTAAAKPDDKKAPPAEPPADDNQLVAKQVFITVGPTRGDQVAILKGVKAGDEVVTSGQLKLKNGTPVVVNNTVQPSSDANPKPVEE